jgi:alpha-beta hydrolase superfamily lysophospholipase
MILHHGVGGNFYRSAMFDRLSDFLLDAGCAVLRANNRGHDLIANGQRNGQPARVGAAFETVAECVHDWQAWIDFAASQGFQRIGVWGHSLGGVKNVYFFATGGDPRVAYAVSSSPPRFAYDMYVAGPDAEGFRRDYQRAQALVDQGQGDTLLEFTLPTRLVLSAATYIDKYGPTAGYDIAAHLPNVQLPMLVTVGGLEAAGPQRISFAGHEATIGPLAASHPALAFQVVPGADHFYTGREEALWETVRTWAQSARAAAATR